MRFFGKKPGNSVHGRSVYETLVSEIRPIPSQRGSPSASRRDAFTRLSARIARLPQFWRFLPTVMMFGRISNPLFWEREMRYSRAERDYTFR